MNIQWYPGHMTKALRMMEENIKIIDLVIEILDARIPLSSKNPDIDTLAKNKMRLIILNKADLADETANKAWVSYYEKKGVPVLLYNSKSNEKKTVLVNTIMDACREKIERDRKRGIINRSIKAMIVGIPNVGKSTFINNLAKRNAATVGNKPGVTKGKQWIKIGKNLDLLDTPGILWPKFEDQETGLNIGFIGSINDNILPSEELAMKLIERLCIMDESLISNRYGIIAGEGSSGEEEVRANNGHETEEQKGKESRPEEILLRIAEARKCYKKGEEPDLKKAAELFLDDFRNGKLGRITLELPSEDE